MMETIDDLTAPWRREGPLARRMLALADERETDGDHRCAQLIREVVKCEYNPVTGESYDYGPFEMPPLRPARPDHTANGHKPKRGEPGS